MDFAGFIDAAFKGSPALRAKFAEAGVELAEVRTPDDLVKLPLTRKSELAARQKDDVPFGGFLTVPLTALQRVFVSPGPIYDPQGPGEDYWGWKEALGAAGFGPGDIVQNTFSYHLTPAGMMFDGALRARGCVVVPAGVGNSELQLQVMRDLGVTGYIGVPSFLYALLKKADELGLTCPGDLKLQKAWVAAEKLSEDLRALLAERYGITVYQGYGTADTGCVAYECEMRKGFHVASRAILEVVDPETGQPVPDGEAGEVVVTILDPVYPLVRFGTGDLGIATAESCPCGRAARRLLGIYGRTSDGVKVRGLFIYPHQVAELQARLGNAGLCRAVVTQTDFRDRLTLQVETPDVANIPDLETRARALAKELLRLTVEVETVSPGTLSGSDKLIVDQRSWK
ncbi:MAG: phenylacetate--CoA ligase family protein [Bacillota bacterium]